MAKQSKLGNPGAVMAASQVVNNLSPFAKNVLALMVPVVAIGVPLYVYNQVKSGGSALLESVGLKDTDVDRFVDSEMKNTNAFDPKLYLSKSNIIVVNLTSATVWANAIDNAIGYIYDDEEAIYAVFRQAKSKADVSRLTDVFFSVTGKDLLGYLRSNLNDSEMSIILAIVKKLPTFKTK